MSDATRIIFLGGAGEIGRNMLAIEADGRILIVDAGLSFPTEEMLGVDLVLPDFSYLVERADRCEAIVLTHGHEDHVGALTWLLKEIDVPVYGTPLTLGLARKRLDEWRIEPRFVEIAAPDVVDIGPFRVTCIAVSHSIPDAIAVAVDSIGGRVIYTGDFKLDDSPIDGRRTDLDTFRRLGDEGVDVLLADSTNADHPGRTGSEGLVGSRLREIFARTEGRIIVACFASNLHRVQQLCDAAEASERLVAFVGRSMVANVQVGRELGHVKVRDESIIDIGEIDRFPPEKTVVICTGSQGEPLSALSLIASGEHKLFTVERGDTVILSASAIPGNESAVFRIINSLYRVGADVYHGEADGVHVSGHGGTEELVELLRAVRPRHFVPVHGEYRHMVMHARLAEGAGIDRSRITIVEDGDVLEFGGGAVRKTEHLDLSMVFVDGLGVGDVGPVVLRDRRLLAGDGFVLCVVTIDAHSGEVLAGPDLISRGFVFEQESRDFLDEAADRVADALEALEQPDDVTDWTVLKRACRRALGEFVWERTRRRPMIVPVIMEV
ncbi:MAG TPA: ribonuclease J [Actinomycetota bacterium]|nr:ribonuclease J [Actinomycetota bacterium]